MTTLTAAGILTVPSAGKSTMATSASARSRSAPTVLATKSIGIGLTDSTPAPSREHSGKPNRLDNNVG